MPAHGIATIPEVGVEFELTLDFDATDPIRMVYGVTYQWKFKGKKPKGVQTGRFKLVTVGKQPNLKAVRKALALHGKVREGQWREAFNAAYPTPDGKGPVGFADPSWNGPDRDRCFPCLRADSARWLSRFHEATRDFDEGWRWLIEPVSSDTGKPED